MAGHSKWNNIKRRKGKEDAKKAKVFSKLSRYITVAARQGGQDPEFNPELKVAIDKAKAENMPNDNIERALKKGAGEDGARNFEEVIYEGYGPDGVAVIVECLTDNKNRTAPDIRHAFDKFGGNLGVSGSVSFMFDKMGTLVIEKTDDIDVEDLELTVIEADADEFTDLGDAFEILVDPKNFISVRDSIEKAGYSFVVSELGYIPQNYVNIEDEDKLKNMIKLVDMLEDNDDVQEIYHNCENIDQGE